MIVKSGKKAVSVVLILLILLLSGCANGNSANDVTSFESEKAKKAYMLTKSYDEEKNYFSFQSLDYNYDKVYVNLMHEISVENFEFYPEDFEGVGNIKSVECLSKPFNPYVVTITNSNFHQWLCIELNTPGKEETIKIINELEALPFVYEVKIDFGFKETFA